MGKKNQRFLIVVLGLATTHACEASLVRKRTADDELIDFMTDGVTASASALSPALERNNKRITTFDDIAASTLNESFRFGDYAEGLEVSHGVADSIVRKTHESKRVQVDAKGNLEVFTGDVDKQIRALSPTQVFELEKRNQLEAALADAIKTLPHNDLVKLSHVLLEAKVHETAPVAGSREKHEVASELVRSKAAGEHVDMDHGGDFAPLKVASSTALLENPMRFESDPNNYRYTGASGGWGGKCLCPDGTEYIVGDIRVNGRMTIACWNGTITKGREYRFAVYANPSRKGWEVTCALPTLSPTPPPTLPPTPPPSPQDPNTYEWTGESGGWGGNCTCPDGAEYIVGDKVINNVMTLACHGGTITKPRTQYWANDHGKKGWEVTCAIPPVPPTPPTPPDTNNYTWTGASGAWGGNCTCPNGAVYIVGDIEIEGMAQKTLACYGGTITFPRTQGWAINNGKMGWEVTCAEVFCDGFTCPDNQFTKPAPSNIVGNDASTCCDPSPSALFDLMGKDMTQTCTPEYDFKGSTYWSVEHCATECAKDNWCKAFSWGGEYNDGEYCFKCTSTNLTSTSLTFSTFRKLAPPIGPSGSCWLRNPTGCPKESSSSNKSQWYLDMIGEGHDTKQWYRDLFGEAHGNTGSSETACLQTRKQQLDASCGVLDTLMHFVPGSGSATDFVKCELYNGIQADNSTNVCCHGNNCGGAHNKQCSVQTDAPCALDAAKGYFINEFNKVDCESGYRIESPHACEKAAFYLKFPFFGASVFYMHPRGCTMDSENKVVHNPIQGASSGQPTLTDRLICAMSMSCATHPCPIGMQHKLGSDDLLNPTDGLCCEQRADYADCMERALCKDILGDLANDKEFMCDCVNNHRAVSNLQEKCREWLMCIHGQRTGVQRWFKELLQLAKEDPIWSNGSSLMESTKSSDEVGCTDISAVSANSTNNTNHTYFDVFSVGCNCAEHLHERCSGTPDPQECLREYACESDEVCDSWKEGHCHPAPNESLSLKEVQPRSLLTTGGRTRLMQSRALEGSDETMDDDKVDLSIVRKDCR